MNTLIDWADDSDIESLLQVMFFSLVFGLVTWDCKKQQALALSLAEAEY